MGSEMCIRDSNTPDAGEIRLNGTRISNQTKSIAAKHRRLDFGYVFQHFNLIPVLSALENIELSLHGHLSNSKARREAALAALEQVGLQDYAKRRPGQLSGGQQQRVGLARAIVRKPKVMIADEPTANLDQDTRDSVLSLIRELSDVHGQTVLMSTHDSAVSELATRRFQIDRGILQEIN